MKKQACKKLLMRIMACFLAAVLSAATVYTDVGVVHATESGVTVTTSSEFLSALTAGKSPITVSGEITLGEDADDSGKMLPVEIPADTVIQGESDATLYFRCPVQITGNNVVIKDIELQFTSSDALGSVPHREIFLAGHSLTLDGVSTYLSGSDGALGGLGGSEEELLPTIYAGGFEGASVGSEASLTIQNASEKTAFQAICMSHDTGSDSKVAYTGAAEVNLCQKAEVRDGIFTHTNSSALINVIGTESGNNNVPDMAFYGNAATTLNVQSATLLRATVDQVGNLVLGSGAQLDLYAGSLCNVTVKNGGVLNANCDKDGSVRDVIVSGDFTGGSYDEESETDERGYLILNKDGSLTVEGTVSSATVFCVDNKSFPGAYTVDKKYISASSVEEGDAGFVLPDSMTNQYTLTYDENGWVVGSNTASEDIVIGSIEVISSPKTVDINTIDTWDIPDEDAPYCEIVWKDTEGNALTCEEVDDLFLYYYGGIIGIKTEYWESETASAETDWSTYVEFYPTDDGDGKYYFYNGSSTPIGTGTYTFLLCSEIYDGDLDTVADVKAIGDTGLIKASFTVTFYDSTQGEAPDPGTGETPDEGEEPDTGENPDEGEEPGTGENPDQGETPDEGETPDPDPDPDPEPEVKEGLWIEEIEDQIYTGKAIRPSINVYDGEKLLSKKDYTVSYRDNKKAGTAQVIVKGRRNYEGSVTAEFRIQPLDINDSSITAKNIYTVLGSSNKTSYRPKITVKYGWITLKESTEDVQRDYSVDWSDLQTDEDGYVTAGSYTVTLNGCGNYTGSRSISFEVLPSDCRFMNKVKVSASKKQMDYFEQENVDFTLTYSEAGTVEELIEGEDYVVLYPEKLVLGRNTITLMAIKGSGYYGSRTYSLNVTGKKISSADITIEGIENAYDYTGKAVTVGEDGLDTLKLTDNTRDVVLTEGKDGDYTLSYEKNINAGTATLTITGRNGYSGRKNIKFKINKINMAEDDRNFSIQTEDSAVYTKLGAKVKTTIQYKEQTLTEGKDYTATYQNNKRIGSASVSIKGKGNYAGEFTKNFTVVPSDASHVSFEVEDVSLNARIHAATLRPKMYITEKSTGRKLTPLTDYDNQIRYYTDEACTQEVTESDMVAGKILWAQLTLKGNYTSGDEAQTLIDSFYLYGTNVSSASIEEIPVQNVNGSSLRPANVVKEKQKIKLDIAEPFADLITNLL